MKDFESLQNLWQQSGNEEGKNRQPLGGNKAAVNSKRRLKNKQLGGCIMLVFTGLLMLAMGLFYEFNFQHWYTYGAIALVALICFGQASLMLYTWKRIKAIDDTASPTNNLQQWEAYYLMRKKQITYGMPVYYLALNGAMGLYFLEVFSGRPIVNVIIFLAVYLAWMAFAYFYLDKRSVKKETARLHIVIGDLKAIVNQLNE
ncbi:MAG: hypothetical protein V4717_05845 [Bacteroidota bacterium]